MKQKNARWHHLYTTTPSLVEITTAPNCRTMENAPLKAETTTRFYAEIPGLHSEKGHSLRIKSTNFERALTFCKYASDIPRYFYIVEAYPDLSREHYQLMPNPVDAIKVTPFNIEGEIDFDPPFQTKSGIICHCRSIEEFVLSYRLPGRFLKESDIYRRAILYGHYYDIITKGHTHISKHDNITGEFLTYMPNEATFREIVEKFSGSGFIRTKFEISNKINLAVKNYLQRTPEKAGRREKKTRPISSTKLTAPDTHIDNIISTLESKGYFGDQYLSKKDLNDFLKVSYLPFFERNSDREENSESLMFHKPDAGIKCNMNIKLVFRFDYYSKLFSLKSIVLGTLNKTLYTCYLNNIEDAPNIDKITYTFKSLTATRRKTKKSTGKKPKK